MEDDDVKLIHRCLQGEWKAFEKIVERYQKPLFNIALKITNRKDEAQDVAQAAFIKAYENLPSFDQKRKFFSWLYRIAINEALNVRNSRKLSNELSEEISSQEQEPDEIVHELQRNQTLEHAVSELSVDYRIVITLRHFQNLSYHEISDVLQVPEKTVKSRLFTARQQLRDMLIKADLV